MSELEDYIHSRLLAFSHENVENIFDTFNGKIPDVYEPGMRPAVISVHNACCYVLHQRKYLDMMTQREERRRALQPRMDSTHGTRHDEDEGE